MASAKRGDGYKDIAHPTSKEVHEDIQAAVKREYYAQLQA
jgi:DNA-binding cell septation regulator SpoVG